MLGILYKCRFKPKLHYFSFSFLLICLEKKKKNRVRLKSLGYYTDMAGPEQVPGSKFHTGPPLVVAAVQEVNQQMEDILLSPSFSVTQPFK